MLANLRNVADGLIGLSAFFGAVGAIFEVIVIIVDVVGRAFGTPLFGSQDLVTMTLVIVVFGGMAVCDRVGGHISVDVLEERFPAAMNRWINAGSALLGAVIFLFITIAVAQSANLSQMLNLSTNLLTLPKAWFQWALCAFAAITALGMLLRATELALSGRDVTTEDRAPG